MLRFLQNHNINHIICIGFINTAAYKLINTATYKHISIPHHIRFIFFVLIFFFHFYASLLKNHNIYYMVYNVFSTSATPKRNQTITSINKIQRSLKLHQIQKGIRIKLNKQTMKIKRKINAKNKSNKKNQTKQNPKTSNN